MSTLPLDKEAALRKMLDPSWQKKKRTGDTTSPVASNPRRQEAVVCGNPACGIVRMVNAGNRKPALCAACSRKASKFNGGSRQ